MEQKTISQPLVQGEHNFENDGGRLGVEIILIPDRSGKSFVVTRKFSVIDEEKRSIV